MVPALFLRRDQLYGELGLCRLRSHRFMAWRVCIDHIPAPATRRSAGRRRARVASCLMKIPRARQNPHVAGMADFLGWIFQMLSPVVIERLDQRGPGRHGMLAAERVIG